MERTLEVLRLESGNWTILAVHAGDEEVRAGPFTATVLPLGRLWVDEPCGLKTGRFRQSRPFGGHA